MCVFFCAGLHLHYGDLTDSSSLVRLVSQVSQQFCTVLSWSVSCSSSFNTFLISCFWFLAFLCCVLLREFMDNSFVHYSVCDQNQVCCLLACCLVLPLLKFSSCFCSLMARCKLPAGNSHITVLWTRVNHYALEHFMLALYMSRDDGITVLPHCVTRTDLLKCQASLWAFSFPA